MIFDDRDEGAKPTYASIAPLNPALLFSPQRLWVIWRRSLGERQSLEGRRRPVIIL